MVKRLVGPYYAEKRELDAHVPAHAFNTAASSATRGARSVDMARRGYKGDELLALADPSARDVDPEDLAGAAEAEDGTRAATTGSEWREDSDADVGRSELRTRAQAPAVSFDDGVYEGRPVSRRDMERRLAAEARVLPYESDSSDASDGSVGRAAPQPRKRGRGGAAAVSRGDGGDSDDIGGESDEDEGDSSGSEDEAEARAVDQVPAVAAAVEEQLRALEDEDALVTMKTKKPAVNEADTATHARNATVLWEHVLEARIALQPALRASNRLPQPAWRDAFVEAPPIGVGSARDARVAAQAADENRAALDGAAADARGVLDVALELQEALRQTSSFAGTVNRLPRARRPRGGSIGDGEDSGDSSSEDDSDAEPAAGSGPRGATSADYWGAVEGSWAALGPKLEATIDEWNNKLKYSSGASEKKLKLLQSSVTEQVDAVLANKERILARAHLRRDDANVLGADVALRGAEGSADERDEETFDDSEFYSQLLKSFVEANAANGGAALDATVAAKRRKAKRRKTVDRRASKGRKLRYTVHEKLVNFMAPRPRDATAMAVADSLYGSVFASS